MPTTRSSGRAASTPEGDTFVVVGGTEYGSIATPFLDTILRFDPGTSHISHIFYTF